MTRRFSTAVSAAALVIAVLAGVAFAGTEPGTTLVAPKVAAAAPSVKPGELITKDNASAVKGLVSPGNLKLVEQGMEMRIVPTKVLEWPPPYKNATEKYAAQVRLGANGTLQNYLAGLPFPLLDANDPQIALKVMWNFSYRPLYNDDVDARYVEVASYAPGGQPGSPAGYFTVGHFALYNNVGRIEVPPIPTDPDARASGIRYRFGFYPVISPSMLHGYGLVRYRYLNPNTEDNVWVFNPLTRRLHRNSPEVMSDALGAVGGFGGAGFNAASAVPEVNNLDPDTYFGFSAKIEDFNYKLLGEKPMLACVHAAFSPARPCPYDGGRTVCPENWEMRRLFVIEADAKPGHSFSIPRRIFYIDSEGWFITASDQYDRKGQLWKTIATFNAYRDRAVPDARVAIYPYKRMFQTALVDENVNSGTSTVVYMPGLHTPERECWYIDMGTVTNDFFMPTAMQNAYH